MRESALMAWPRRAAGSAHECTPAAPRRRSSRRRRTATRRSARVFLAELDLTEGKPGDALGAYKKFAKDHPKSPYLEKVRGFIASSKRRRPSREARPDGGLRAALAFARRAPRTATGSASLDRRRDARAGAGATKARSFVARGSRPGGTSNSHHFDDYLIATAVSSIRPRVCDSASPHTRTGSR